MFKVKIYGAGSIGNHLAHASRRMGWDVVICDIDEKALERTKNKIYPSRYGKWDDQIRLATVKDVEKGGFDIIIVGTPPDSHIKIAFEALREKPKAILVEKPFCTPDISTVPAFYDSVTKSNTAVFVGYDHTVGKAACTVLELIRSGLFKDIQTLDVEFREHWAGIFQAHPWLQRPADSYLGHWKRGGGASGEHSHALNLWQYFASSLNIGKVVEIGAMLAYEKIDNADYDKICSIQMRTEKGISGRIVQDVVTLPVQKGARIQYSNGSIAMNLGVQPGRDIVTSQVDSLPPEVTTHEKTRPDDFIQELRHIEAVLLGQLLYKDSPLRLEAALESMLIISACHKSNAEKRNILIKYEKGFGPESLS